MHNEDCKSSKDQSLLHQSLLHFSKSSNIMKLSAPSDKTSSTENDIDVYEELITTLLKTQGKQRTFQTNYLAFKKALMFKKIHRKTNIDSVLKKCKSRFFKAIQDCIKKIIGEKTLVSRLPQAFITNVNIDYNRNYMNKEIWEIYEQFKLIDTISASITNENFPKERKEMLLELMKMTYKEGFVNYMESSRYKDDYFNIKLKEGEKFALLYSYVSKIYIEYYEREKIK